MKNDLMAMFPAYGFPMEVWIDKNGLLIAITDSYFITSENIRKATQGAKVDFPLSSSYIVSNHQNTQDYKTRIPEDTSFLSRIYGYSDTVPKLRQNFFKRQKEGQVTHYSIFNTSIVNLFLASLYKGRTVHNDRLVSIELPDVYKYLYPKTDTNFFKNQKLYTYCYVLNVPSSVTFENAMSLMNHELSTYFQMESSIEKRLDTCYVLKQIKPTFNLKTVSQLKTSYYDRAIGLVKFQNVPLKDLVAFLYSKETPIIIDETGYKTNIDVELRLPPNRNLNDINSTLKFHNLILKKEVRLIDKMVLKKKQPS